jgi:hypothetical protein
MWLTTQLLRWSSLCIHLCSNMANNLMVIRYGWKTEKLQHYSKG